MGRRIYVGNLPWSTTSDELNDMFGEFGGVVSAEVLQDRETGRSRGFGFVEMENDEAMQAAIAGMNGKDMGGRALTVNEARERTERAGGGGGRGGYGGGGGGRGGYGGGGGGYGRR
jgi:RNA recognition motif-containing protein